MFASLSTLATGCGPSGQTVQMPDTRDAGQSFSIVSPKLLFYSQFITHEMLTIQYSKYFYGEAFSRPDPRPATIVPSAPIAPYGYGAPELVGSSGVTGLPDENVFKIQATMWW